MGLKDETKKYTYPSVKLMVLRLLVQSLFLVSTEVKMATN